MFRMILLRLLAVANARLAKRAIDTPQPERAKPAATKGDKRPSTPNTIYPLW